MKRVTTYLATALFVLAVTVLPAMAGQSTPAPVRRVVLVLAPYLRWSDVTTATPNITAIAEEGAVANLNVRNRNRAATFPATSEQGALTFSSGAWSAMDSSAPSAYTVGEEYNQGTAAEAFTRLTGMPPSGADIVFLGLPRVLRQSAANNSLDVVPGTLGGEIVAAGGATAAIGNGDPGRDTRAIWRSRAAAIAAMDYDGLVRYGDISGRMLRDDITEPFGVASDVERIMAAYHDAEASIAETDGPGLIVVDPGDLSRAAAIEGITAQPEWERQRARAVAALDDVVGRIDATLPEDAVLMIASPVEIEAIGVVTHLAPVIVSGPGMRGRLSSSSTQRTGLVTNLDIAATILRMLGIERPVQVLGNPMVADGTDASLDARIAGLSASDATAVAVDAAKPAVVNGFIGVTLAILVASTLVLLRAHRWSREVAVRSAWVFRAALLGILSVPPATLLMFVVAPDPSTPASAVFTLAMCTVALWALALLLKRFAPMRVPVAASSLLMTVLLLLDQALGAPWSFTSFLGYSPLLAARYYGIGNEGAALLFGSSLVGVALLLDEWPDSRYTQFVRRWGLPFLGATVVGACAAPFLGANVGVVAWGVIGYAVAWALMNGYRVSWKLMGFAVIIIIVLVGAFSMIDLKGGSSQTHLGRAWLSADQGGPGALWTIVERKAETNLRVLTRTNWSFVLIGVLAFLGFMRWRPQGDFAAALDDNPHFSAAMAACLIGGLAAYFTEDSGIVIPALIMVYLAAGVLYLMLDRLRTEPHHGRADGEVQVSGR